jgi:MEDS: MEthanogen/methylotroph, DcmR Sensory domain
LAKIFVERTSDGHYRALRNKRLVAIGQTQGSVGLKAHHAYPDDLVYGERIRYIPGSDLDMWRLLHKPSEHLAAVELGIRGERVSISDHVAYFWETEVEFGQAVGFLEVGFLANEHGVIFGHPSANAHVLSVLTADGFDQATLEKKGRLTVIGGRPLASDMLGEIGNAFRKAIDRGAPLVRLLGNIGWGLKDWPGELDTLEFESRVTEACKSFPCVVVCMYDVANLSGRIMVHGAYETHRLTVCGSVLRENPHYVVIDSFLSRLADMKKL